MDTITTPGPCAYCGKPGFNPRLPFCGGCWRDLDPTTRSRLMEHAYDPPDSRPTTSPAWERLVGRGKAGLRMVRSIGRRLCGGYTTTPHFTQDVSAWGK